MIKVKRINGCELPLPSRGSVESAGLDLAANETVYISPNKQTLVGTGFKFQIPSGYVGLIWPRSGKALKGLDTRAGVIDSDYRGEVKVLIRNESDKQICIPKGERFAQLVIQPVNLNECIEADELDESVRNEGGFGSTGVE